MIHYEKKNSVTFKEIKEKNNTLNQFSSKLHKNGQWGFFFICHRHIYFCSSLFVIIFRNFSLIIFLFHSSKCLLFHFLRKVQWKILYLEFFSKLLRYRTDKSKIYWNSILIFYKTYVFFYDIWELWHLFLLWKVFILMKLSRFLNLFCKEYCFKIFHFSTNSHRIEITIKKLLLYISGWVLWNIK